MEPHQTWEPWNKGKLVGQKPPLKPVESTTGAAATGQGE